MRWTGGFSTSPWAVTEDWQGKIDCSIYVVLHLSQRHVVFICGYDVFILYLWEKTVLYLILLLKCWVYFSSAAFIFYFSLFFFSAAFKNLYAFNFLSRMKQENQCLEFFNGIWRGADGSANGTGFWTCLFLNLLRYSWKGPAHWNLVIFAWLK